MIINNVIASLSFGVALALPFELSATEFPVDHKKGAIEKLKEHLLAERNGDFEAYFDTMPPAYLAKAADAFGISLPEFEAAFFELMQSKNGPVNFEQVSTDIDIKEAEFGITEIGRPYAFFPVRFRTEIDGVVTDLLGHVIVIKDKKEWFALSLVTASPAIFLRSAYPDLVGVQFPIPSKPGSGEN